MKILYLILVFILIGSVAQTAEKESTVIARELAGNVWIYKICLEGQQFYYTQGGALVQVMERSYRESSTPKACIK